MELIMLNPADARLLFPPLFLDLLTRAVWSSVSICGAAAAGSSGPPRSIAGGTRCLLHVAAELLQFATAPWALPEPGRGRDGRVLPLLPGPWGSLWGGGAGSPQAAAYHRFEWRRAPQPDSCPQTQQEGSPSAPPQFETRPRKTLLQDILHNCLPRGCGGPCSEGCQHT